MSDAVDHPVHYNAHPSGVECVTVAEHFGFNLGNAIKYVWRAGVKSADPVEDLRKAAWYLNREIDRLLKDRCAEALKRPLAPERETSVLSADGSITLPPHVVAALKLKPGEYVYFVQRAPGFNGSLGGYEIVSQDRMSEFLGDPEPAPKEPAQKDPAQLNLDSLRASLHSLALRDVTRTDLISDVVYELRDRGLLRGA